MAYQIDSYDVRTWTHYDTYYPRQRHAYTGHKNIILSILLKLYDIFIGSHNQMDHQRAATAQHKRHCARRKWTHCAQFPLSILRLSTCDYTMC